VFAFVEKRMSNKRTGLGRGLDALLGDVEVSKPVPVTGPATQAPESQSGEGLRMIAVDLLRRGAYQPRREIDQTALEELAASIRSQGLIQPIIVRPHADRDAAGARQYEIVAGERRWRAAQLAGLEAVPAMVREMPDSAAIAVALIENIQREDLGPLEEAAALRRLIDEFDLTHEAAADAIGRSRAAVSNLVRLLDLGDATKELVHKGKLEMGHARALLAISDPRKQADVAVQIAKHGLSVRQTESLVKRVTAGGNKAASTGPVDPDIRQLQDKLADKLGARVAIQHGAKGHGKLVVSYNSLDELEGILEHIK
jgi:ParB family chromosome partitioning protein